MSNQADVIVVGGGHNGLVAACYLSAAGLKVHVLESRSIIGGACVTEELIPGFRFSTCANAAWALDSKVVADLSLPELGLVMDSPDPIRFHPFPDGSYLYIWQDAERTVAEIARLSRADAEAWTRWSHLMARLGDIFAPLRYGPAPHIESFAEGLSNADDSQLVRKLATSTVDQVIDEFFTGSHMRTSMSSYGPFLFSGGSALGIAWAAMLTHGSMAQGYPRGGMGAITQALRVRAERNGAIIETGVTVESIVVEAGRAAGVSTRDGRYISADVVVSNTDPKRTFLRLLDERHVDPGLRQAVNGLHMAPSAAKLHCAVSDLPHYTAHSSPDKDLPSRASVKLMPDRSVLSGAYADAADGRVPQHPAISVMTPSIYDRSLAPDGRHTVSLWVSPMPYRLTEGSWDEARNSVAERLVDLVSGYAPDFRKSIIQHVLLTPADLEQRVLLTEGNIHHGEEVASQLFGRRPLSVLANYRAPVEGLYLCGAGAHPGGEITGLPGHNAAHVILDDLRRGD